jgi:hypothetical protein
VIGEIKLLTIVMLGRGWFFAAGIPNLCGEKGLSARRGQIRQITVQSTLKPSAIEQRSPN